MSLQEYLLLRHDVVPKPGREQELKGEVVISLGSRAFTLSSSFLSQGEEIAVYSAHTNKEHYLTSHLYLTNRDLPSGSSRSMPIHYVAGVAAID